MEQRVGAVCALIAFAMSVVIGAFEAGNSFSSVLATALKAMLASYVVGYLVGWAAEAMMKERRDAAEAKKTGPAEGTPTDGR